MHSGSNLKDKNSLKIVKEIGTNAAKLICICAKSDYILFLADIDKESTENILSFIVNLAKLNAEDPRIEQIWQRIKWHRDHMTKYHPEIKLKDVSSHDQELLNQYGSKKVDLLPLEFSSCVNRFFSYLMSQDNALIKIKFDYSPYNDTPNKP
jgi:hypothetical protein